MPTEAHDQVKVSSQKMELSIKIDKKKKKRYQLHQKAGKGIKHNTYNKKSFFIIVHGKRVFEIYAHEGLTTLY